MNWRIVLFGAVLLAFLVFQLLPNLIGEWLREPPPADVVDEVSRFELQVDQFREQLPMTEVINYRIALKRGEQLDSFKVVSDVIKVKYAVCPALINEKPEARDLPHRIINTSGELRFVQQP